MFERLKVDDANQTKDVAVEIMLADDQVVAGNIRVPVQRTVFTVLNSDAGFIDFNPFEGERAFIAKSAVRSVRPLQEISDVSRDALSKRSQSFDPHAILEIEKGTDTEGLRQAYLKLTKLYHPDRFANAGLPSEVSDYLAVRAQQINMAYDVLKSAQPKVKAVRSEPVWESKQPQP